MRLVGPVARTASTGLCAPATWHEAPGEGPPSRQHVHAAVESAPPSGQGSLKSSKIAALLPLKAAATCDQKVGAWSRSGIGTCPVAFVVPGAVQCRSRIA